MENTERKNPLLKFWPQLTAGAVFIFWMGTSFNSFEATATKIFGIEDEHDHDVEYLNEEDDGVKGDMIELAKCNKEIAKLENDILYYKIKYEDCSSK